MYTHKEVLPNKKQNKTPQTEKQKQSTTKIDDVS